ncbi:hypothetical protein FS837_001391 [Tulasnella sp. UAMH 9824]|nr:hypothetical protein FS837_001391 [Tulasnella sp. UAMH 9824]
MKSPGRRRLLTQHSDLTHHKTKALEDSGEETKTRKIPAASVKYREEVVQSTIQSTREKNSLVAVNRLPMELLITVFQDSLETPSDRFKGLKTIASVAWMWLNIVKGSPGLWAALDSRTPVALLPIFFKRAGVLPFTIRMHYPPLNDGGEERNSRAFLDMVLPMLGRWREASLILHREQSDPAETLGMLEKPAPFLEEFHLKSEMAWSGGQIDLFQGHAPNLTEMTIDVLPIRWSSSIFHNIVYVGIRELGEAVPQQKRSFN